MHFTLNNKTYQQCDGVAMCQSLGPMNVGKFMVVLEKSLIPTLI